MSINLSSGIQVKRLAYTAKYTVKYDIANYFFKKVDKQVLFQR
jgi:hypothetical protein